MRAREEEMRDTNGIVMKFVNACHAEYFYVLHYSPIFILLTCSIPVVNTWVKVFRIYILNSGF